MSAKAVQRLARLREEHVRDHKGRDKAGHKLFDQFITACTQAGLHLGAPDGHIHQVALWHPPEIKVNISTAEGDILLGKGSAQKVLETGLVYDPINQVFVPSDPDSTDEAVDILTDKVARLLEEKGHEYRRRKQPPVDRDFEEALEEAAPHPYG